MNRDTKVSDNTLNSSPLYGIHVSLPSDNVYVESNKITGSGGSGIKVARVDLEDEEDQTIPTVATHERPQYRATGIRISNNNVALSSTIGIEVEMTHGALIAENNRLPYAVQFHLSSAYRLNHRPRQPPRRFRTRCPQARAQRRDLRRRGRHTGFHP